MNRRSVLIIASAVLALTFGFVLWRAARPKPLRYIIAKKHRAAPKAAPAKKAKAPKVAIVMDDLGNNMNQLDEIFAIKEPITFSILPNLKFSGATADECRSNGYEVILHLPLEPHRRDVKEEFDTIKSGMSAEDVLKMLGQEIGSVPGLKGVSNHMGSKSTEERPLMRVILSELKRKNLYFFDSLTSEKSVCGDVASETGERYARRDIFLDNTETVEHVEKQLLQLRKLAFKKGRAIAVCHYKKNTVTALSRTLPGMARDGIRFVYLSELVN